MKNNNSNNNSSELGFINVLQLIFITLKLIKVINWPWVWVLSPTWISGIIFLAVIAIAFLIARREG